MTLVEKRKLMEAKVTLNGEPARIIGAFGPFATVRTTEQTPAWAGEWTWETVRRVVNTDGKFKI